MVGGWLVGWLVGWFVGGGWLVGWFVGWLVCCFVVVVVVVAAVVVVTFTVPIIVLVLLLPPAPNSRSQDNVNIESSPMLLSSLFGSWVGKTGPQQVDVLWRSSAVCGHRIDYLAVDTRVACSTVQTTATRLGLFFTIASKRKHAKTIGI